MPDALLTAPSVAVKGEWEALFPPPFHELDQNGFGMHFTLQAVGPPEKEQTAVFTVPVQFVKV
jgi:hypothetical protein